MSFRQKLIISLIIGVIHILPDTLFICYSGKQFQGIALSATADELFYMGRFNMLRRGFGALAGHGLSEHLHDDWSVHSPYKEALLSLPSRLFGLNNWQNDMILTFFMPVLFFWVAFYLVEELSGSGLTSLVPALMIIFGYNVFTINLNHIITIFSPHTNSYLWFMRSVSPQLPHLVLFLCLLFSYKAIKSGSIPKAMISAFLAGFLIYVNFFYWAFFILGFFIFTVLILRRNSPGIFKVALTVFFISTVIILPFWLHYMKISSIPSYQDIKFRFNIESGDNFVMPFSQVLLFGYILFFLRKDFGNRSNLFLLSFLMAGFVLLNQQMITKVKLPAIYIQNYLLKTFLLISAIIVTAKAFKKLPIRYKYINFFMKRLVLISCAVIAVCGILIQFNHFKNYRAEFMEYQKLRVVFDWLNKNTRENDVILTDPFDKTLIADFLLAYTHDCVYLPRSIAVFISNKEFLERYLMALKFFAYSEEDIKNNPDTLCGIYGLASLKEYGGKINCQREVQGFIETYNRLRVKDVFNYKVDFVINSNPDLKDRILKSYPFVKLTYESDGVQVFEIVHKNIAL